jgi:acetolactate synthase I/II/III large subunit
VASCGEALVEILEGYGVDTVFGIPGVHTIELYRGLPRSRIRHVTPRHEQGAGFMADGYARVSGKPGVCLIITGPGVTNIATAMGQALRDSIPMLVISSVNRIRQLGMGEGFLHELPDQSRLMAGVAVFSHRVTHVDQLPGVIARAFTVFRSRRPGPVHIEIPMDVLTERADHLDRTPFPIPEPPGPVPSAVAKAAEYLGRAQRPLIAIGGGAVNAAAEVIELAEALDAPVVNTVNAKGVIPFSHPLAVGGSGSCAIIREEFRAADVVLAVGTEFSETDYDFFFNGAVQIEGKLIRIDIDAEQLSRNVKPTLAMVSDSAPALRAIKAALPPGRQRANDGPERTQALRAGVRTTANARYDDFFRAIDEALPDSLIVGDSAQPVYYAWLHHETERPRRYFHSASGFGTLGYAIPAAIGAKVGAPDVTVVALIGDGGAQFTLSELASAVEAGTPVIFIIWNNRGYGEIRRFMDDASVARAGVDIGTPDFMALAKGFGCANAHPENLGDLKAALSQAKNSRVPTVLEVSERDFADGYPFP